MRISPITRRVTFGVSANPDPKKIKEVKEESYIERQQRLAEEKFIEDLKKKQEEWVKLIHRPQKYSK